MSVSTYQGKVDKLRTDIASLRKKLAQEKDKEARKSKELASVTRSAVKTSSTSTARTRTNKANNLVADIAKIQKGIADLEGKIAAKAKDLGRYEQQLSGAQAKEGKTRRAEELKHERTLTQEARMRHRVESLRSRLSEEFPDYEISEDEETKYDVFISYAHQDKNFVEPLAELLVDRGFRAWYDKFELTVGDSLREKIDRGIANSEYGLVVLSPHFFARARGWTDRELGGLTTREVAGRRKLILPIWHNVDRDDVLEYSPTLADKSALNTKEMDLEEIADALAEVLPGRASSEDREELEDLEAASALDSDMAEIESGEAELIPWEQAKARRRGGL